MDAVLVAITSSLLSVAGSGLLHSCRQARRLEAEADQRLIASLSEFGYALDALILELQHLPASQQRAVTAWRWIERHFGTLDFFVGRIARVFFGRQLYAALGRLQRVTNELMLIAPPPAIEALTPIFERLSSFGDRGENWFELLQSERSAFAAVSRSIVTSKPIDFAPAREH